MTLGADFVTGSANPYRQTISPSAFEFDFVGDDTDDHDYIFPSGGKDGFTAIIRNLTDQNVTVSVYSAELVTSDIGDGGVVLLTTTTVPTLEEPEMVVRDTAPYHILRLTQAVAGDGAGIAVKVYRQTAPANLSGRTINIVLPAADINAGVAVALPPFSRWTLYIEGTAADNIRVELSPNGGADWYRIEESPFTIDAQGFSTTELGYDADRIRLTNETGTDVTAAQVRGVV